MAQSKIDYQELNRLLREGESQNNIAKVFNVTPGRISQAKREMRNRICKVTTLEKAGDVVNDHLDTMAQLRKINTNANTLLDLLMAWQAGDQEAIRVLENQVKRVKFGKGDEAIDITEIKMKDPRELALKCMAEIRNQLRLQMELWQAYLEWNDRKQFQEEVLQILDEFEPGTRERAVERLKRRALLRGAVNID